MGDPLAGEDGHEYRNNHIINMDKQYVVQRNISNLECDECRYKASTEKRLKKHIRRTHGNNLRCSRCDYAPKDRITLLHHVRAKHEKIKAFKCTECKFAVGFSYSLSRHMKRFHPALDQKTD